MILDVGMEKEQKGWRVSALPITACQLYNYVFTAYSGMQEWVIQIPSIPTSDFCYYVSIKMEVVKKNCLYMYMYIRYGNKYIILRSKLYKKDVYI